MNCQMVLNNTNKNNSILLEVFASVFTVSSYFTDNPRMHHFFSNKVRFLAHVFTVGDPQFEWLKRNEF